MPAISVDDVSKRFRLIHERNGTIKAMVMRGMKRIEYEEFWALQNVSFEVNHGETFAIIGHNGSGKSTMLKCLASIYRPDNGSIQIDGVMSALLELGAGFHPELSGRENVYLNASILGLSKKVIDQRFDDIVEFAGLEQFIDSPVKNYSSGMFVRLGFSVAINIEPDVLLIDEVLSVGDEEFQRRCMQKIRSIRADGRTVVVVTHSIDTVRSICDRALWIDHGTMKAYGTAHDVSGAYLDAVIDPADKIPLKHLRGIRAELVPTSGPHASLSIEVDLEDVPENCVLIVDLVRHDGPHITGSTHRLAAGSGRFAGESDPIAIGPGEFIARATLQERTGTVIEHIDANVSAQGDMAPLRGAVDVAFRVGQTI